MYGQPVHVGEYKPIKCPQDQDETHQDNYHEQGNDLTRSGNQDGESAARGQLWESMFSG